MCLSRKGTSLCSSKSGQAVASTFMTVFVLRTKWNVISKNDVSYDLNSKSFLFGSERYGLELLFYSLVLVFCYSMLLVDTPIPNYMLLHLICNSLDMLEILHMSPSLFKQCLIWTEFQENFGFYFSRSFIGLWKN